MAAVVCAMTMPLLAHHTGHGTPVIAFTRILDQARLQNHDWKAGWKGISKGIGRCILVSRCGFCLRKGSLRSNRSHNGLWKFSSMPESTTGTKVSEQEENSIVDDFGSLDERSLFQDMEKRSKHTSPPAEELFPAIDAVMVEAADKVAETVEAAVQTVSSVGEIELPVPVEQPVVAQELAVKTVVFWVCAAIAFGLIIGLKDGTGKASEFFAGYLVEQSLSVDNLFVFVIIFKYFRVPYAYQRFEAVNLFFASVLIFSSYKLLTQEDEEDEDFSKNYIVNTCRRFIPVAAQYDGKKFFTTIDGHRKATPLLLTLAVVELSDIAFAVDSIPAVFGVTRDPLIVFSSNIFAILGLRSLYTLVSSSMDELDYLQPSVAVVLGFIGSKMVADFFGYHTSTEVSLGFVISVIGTGIGLSLWKNRRNDQS